MRSSGILLPVASLPSKYGIGAFSKEAYEFVDLLEAAGQSIWQVLPLGPTGYGDSPYQSFSTFAGNPYFIDLEELIKRGWLTKKDCERVDFGSDESKVDYEKIYRGRFRLLKKAYKNSGIEKEKGFRSFVKENSYWLTDYTLFMAIKDANKGKSFDKWPEGLKKHKKAALEEIKKDPKIAESMGCYAFMQYLFFEQWFSLKEYANKKGVKIIGDIPIYVAYDSADYWSDPRLFKTDKNGTPTGVEGCPPDYFSATGQLWGNPLYDWEYHKKTGYAWWMKRLANCFRLYDAVRIDHFRGFDEYYNIPYGAENAIGGHWEKGPGYELFETMKKTLGKKDIIAEDLGYLTDSVVKLVKKTGYPGMKVLEFAFDSNEDNDYLPHNFEKNCVVYTGTHDNDTAKGWYENLNSKDKKYAREYLNVKSAKDIEKALIRLALASTADTAIIPMQDYLGLGSEGRINIPSTLGGNWCWRMKKSELDPGLAEEIRRLTELYGRGRRDI